MAGLPAFEDPSKRVTAETDYVETWASSADDFQTGTTEQRAKRVSNHIAAAMSELSAIDGRETNQLAQEAWEHLHQAQRAVLATYLPQTGMSEV
ncbi:hypothetical protein [Mycobacteroides abscessus]|uniref:hypothetical protein n=1 Tax=Mycobacteroides abscessus TaxID=36809 RepID=UPI0021073548|nr:hypothetical protein [Mycobacteroides abscessus]